jgi:hypothetical protein
MPVFAVVPLVVDPSPLNKAVEEVFPNETDRFKLNNGKGWLVVFDGTSKAVCEHIGITGQSPGDPVPIGSTLVVPFSSYYGRGSSDMWEWLALKLAS